MQAPYLQIAFVCDHIPQDGKMSVRDLPGKITVKGFSEKMPVLKTTLTVFVGFIAGEYTGKAKLRIRPFSPSGKILDSLPFSEIEFQKSLSHRVTASIAIEDLSLPEAGLYWLDVLLNEEVAARIPLEVEYRQETLPPRVEN